MVELTPDERAALAELVKVESTGGSVPDFITHRLYDELSHVVSEDRFGDEDREYDPRFDSQRRAYVGLYEKGLLDASPPSHIHRGYWFNNLTGDGRFYFEMESRANKAKEEELDESRRYARKQALIAFLASAALTLVINARAIYDNVCWLLSLIP